MFFIPETLHLHSSGGRIVENTPAINPSILASQNGSEPVPQRRFSTNLANLVQLQRQKFYDATSILHSLPIILCLLTFVIHASFRLLTNFATRYISKRYSWSLADTSFLLSLRAGVNVLLLLAILPLIAYLLTTKPAPGNKAWYTRFSIGISLRAKDLLLARASLLFLILGLVLLAAAPTIEPAILALVIFTLGAGFSHLMRSVVTTLVDQEHVGRLYSAISVVEIFSLLVLGPGLAGLYAWGLKQVRVGGSQMWIGAPYFGSAVLFAVTGAGVFAVRLPRSGKGGVETGGGDEDGVEEGIA